jgi:hypothetical protein
MEISSAELGNRFEAAADVENVLDEGEAADVVQLLKAILLELRLLRAAVEGP